MSWVKLDDHAHEHRKQAAAGPAACWLWVCGLMWCNRQAKRDGVIPEAVIPMLFPGAKKQLAERLVEVGLWEHCDDGYRVHDYHDFQPTDEQVADRREKRREAGRIGGRRSGESRRSRPEANAKQLASNVRSFGEAKTNPDPDPDPVPDLNNLKPVCDLERGSRTQRIARTLTHAPDSMEVSEAVRARCAMAGAPPPTADHVEAFLRNARKRAHMFADWDEALIDWMVNEKKFRARERAPGKHVQPTDFSAPWMQDGYGETLGKTGGDK